MSTMSLKAIGLSEKDVLETLTDKLVHELFEESSFENKLQAMVQKAIDQAVDKIAKANLNPRVEDMVSKVCLQDTNRWGEVIGKKLTFTEYLVARAEKYLTEEVDYEGRPKNADSYGWKAYQTRMTHMIHKHLHYNIENSMKDAVNIVNKSLVPSLEEAVKIKLEEIAKGLKMNVEIKR